jgi:hypothetical protein
MTPWLKKHNKLYTVLNATVKLLVDYKITNSQHDMALGWEKSYAGGGTTWRFLGRAVEKVIIKGH